MAEWRRRTYLVDRSFQIKYILLLMAWGVVLSALFGLWTYQAHQQAIETVVRGPAQRALVDRADRQLMWPLVGIGALSVTALGLLGFVLTHRVAGPVYVMGHFVNLLAQGRYPTRRALRKHDELQGFYARFLDAIEAMKERDERHVGKLEETIVLLRGAVARVPELGVALEVLEREVKDRREALAESTSPAAGVFPLSLEGRGQG
ncbi:MAG: hypothetical protein A2V77_14175 [Anaeromyxobacter sp. RBG_16_69_14]|nr:MAG: hypothetical protein A2V77_14175 [Anaeromyxobacter sp. RBG_16_69_14]